MNSHSHLENIGVFCIRNPYPYRPIGQSAPIVGQADLELTRKLCLTLECCSDSAQFDSFLVSLIQTPGHFDPDVGQVTGTESI